MLIKAAGNSPVWQDVFFFNLSTGMCRAVTTRNNCQRASYRKLEFNKIKRVAKDYNLNTISSQIVTYTKIVEVDFPYPEERVLFKEISKIFPYCSRESEKRARNLLLTNSVPVTLKLSFFFFNEIIFISQLPLIYKFAITARCISKLHRQCHKEIF